MSEYLDRLRAKENGDSESSSSNYASSLRKRASGGDLSNIENLRRIADEENIKYDDPNKPTKFQRVFDVIQRPLYASAGGAKALLKNENFLEEVMKGLSGKEKETYSDVLSEAGVKNKYAKAIGGLALDIALDPTTYLGGAAVKGVMKGAKIAGKTAATPVKLVTPRLYDIGIDSANSIKDALGTAFKYGYGTTEGLADDAAKSSNLISLAKEDIANTNYNLFKKFSKKDLEVAGKAMIENRRLERMAREGEKVKYIKPKNKKAEEAMRLMMQKGEELAKKAGIDEPSAYKYYFPIIDTEKLAKTSKEAAALNAGKQGYLKEWKNLVPDEKILNKPIEAYTRREYDIVRDNIIKESMQNFVTKYGKQFNSAEEAAANGYMPVYKKGVSIFKQGKPIGYLKENDFKFINNMISPEMKTVDILAKNLGYDAFSRFWKSSVTSWFPAFHVRNMASGLIQNYEVLGKEAFNPKNHNVALGILKGSDKQLRLGGNIYSAKQLNEVLRQNFSGRSAFIADIGKYIDELDGNMFSFSAKAKKALSSPQKVGDTVETYQKATAMVAALRKGHSLDEAVKLAEKAGFDYSKITPFEERFLRRLIPFYTFTRKNLELQAKTLKDNPERILNIAKTTNTLGDIFGGKMTQEDMEGLPPWARSAFGFKLGEKDGKMQYLTSFGTPVEAALQTLERPGKTTLSSTNPIIKYAAERQLGYDFFREKDIQDIQTLGAGLGKVLMDKEKTPEWMREALNVKEYTDKNGVTRYSADPNKLHLLRSIPTSRMMGALNTMFDGNKTQVQKALSLLTGLAIYDIDKEQQEYFNQRDLQRDIEDALVEHGAAKKFERLYIPKE